MKELKTFTTGKGTYDSFPDKTARAELPKKLTRPATAQVGDYLRIKAIGADGSMEVEAAPAPEGGNGGSNVAYPDWSHLKWHIIGDSLTDRNNDFAPKRYYDFISAATGIKLSLDGIGGTGYGAGVSTNKHFVERVKHIPDDADIVTIFGSANDIKYADGANSEIFATLSWLTLNRPGLRCIVVPPAPVKWYDRRAEEWTAYNDRLKLCAFVCGHRFVADMYECPPFDPNNEQHMTVFFTTDELGIHPNEAGHKAMAPIIYNALLQELELGNGTPANPSTPSPDSGQNVNNPWRGKRWLCIGDSITTEGGVYATTGYGKLISRDLGMVLHNIAVSGKTAAWGCEVLDSCAEDYDLITVMLGTNDHGYACPIGALNDDYYAAGDYASSGSFYARMQLLVEKLNQKFPKSLVLVLTPIKRTAVNPAYSNIANNDAGYQINTTLKLTTEAYRDAVIDVCNYYSVPYVDLYNTIDPRTEANRELYFMSAADGTHPNDLGHALKLAPVIRDAIIRHTPYVFPEWDITEPDNPDAPDVPVDPDEPEEPGGDATAPELIHAYGLGVKGEPIEDTVGDCDMTASGELHGVHCNEGTWNLDRGSSFSLRSKATRNTRYYRVSHRLHTGARSGMHVAAGNIPYDMTGRLWIGLDAPAGVTATNGDAVVSFWYYTANNSTEKSEVRYGSKVVAPGGSVELALTFDADTSTVRIYQDGEKIIEEVTSVPLAVDGLVVYGNWASDLPAGAELGASPCEYIEMYRGVITV